MPLPKWGLLRRSATWLAAFFHAAFLATLFSALVAPGARAGAEGTDAPVIAFLGDSLVQGYGLAPEDGLVAQAQRWLDGHGVRAKLLNAGVSGDTTAGGLARLEWTVAGDVDGLAVLLGGNDALRGLAPEGARANLDAILGKAREKGLPVLLIGMRAPANYGPEYKRAFDSLYADLAERHGVLFLPDYLAPLTGRADRAETLRRYFQPDGIHPNAQGVALLVERLGPKLAELARMAGAKARN